MLINTLMNIKLKTKREENGLSVEEVAEDLKMRPSQITSIEEGKLEDFKDVFYLKYFIRDYAKYLGLDGERMLDEFNEYLFDITSKIPVNLIEQAKKEQEQENVSSPYTKETKKKFTNVQKLVIGIVILVITIIVGCILISNHKGNDFQSTNITYNIRR